MNWASNNGRLNMDGREKDRTAQIGVISILPPGCRGRGAQRGAYHT